MKPLFISQWKSEIEGGFFLIWLKDQAEGRRLKAEGKDRLKPLAFSLSFDRINRIDKDEDQEQGHSLKSIASSLQSSAFSLPST